VADLPVAKESPNPAAWEQAAAADPAEALPALAALRDHALRSGDLDLLSEVNSDGSPAAAADRRTADRLRRSGLVLEGFSTSLSGVTKEEGAATSAYKEQDAQGSVRAEGAATAGQPLRLVLVSVGGKWRISEILPGS
jgi:hypothetical protein